MSKTQLETMASEDASINSLNQRKQKPEQTRKQKYDHTQKKEVPEKNRRRDVCVLPLIIVFVVM